MSTTLLGGQEGLLAFAVKPGTPRLVVFSACIQVHADLLTQKGRKGKRGSVNVNAFGFIRIANKDAKDVEGNSIRMFTIFGPGMSVAHHSTKHYSTERIRDE